MITLYAHPGSTCTRKVITALVETGTPYEFSLVDLAKGEHKQPAHLARQPFGQVPAIDDDGFVLYEARAICRYVSAKAGDKLVPTDLKQRALMDQFSSVEQSNFSAHAMKFIYHYAMKRNQEESVLAAAGAALGVAYNVLAKALDESEFVVGSAFSIADIGFMPYIEYMQHSPAHEILAKHPSVVAWWQRVSARPSWQKASGKA